LRKNEDDFYVPSILKTKEFLESFPKREKLIAPKLYEKVIGNHDWILYLQNLEMLINNNANYYKDDLGTWEKAVYGAICGNKNILLEMSNTWHDKLWATLKSFFSTNVLKQFVALRPDYSILFTGSTEFGTLPPAGPPNFSSDLLSSPTNSVFFLLWPKYH